MQIACCTLQLFTVTVIKPNIIPIWGAQIRCVWHFILKNDSSTNQLRILALTGTLFRFFKKTLICVDDVISEETNILWQILQIY